MVSVNGARQHAVLLPFPAQGHVNPFLKLAKLLHHKGYVITFVNTEYNQRRRLSSGGADALEGLRDFQFAAIPDGLPPSDGDSTQDIPSLCQSTTETCLEPFCKLLAEVNSAAGPPVSVVIADGVMSFALKAGERLGLPTALFWTTSACGFLGYTQYPYLLEKGYTPLKDESQLTDGYLETTVDGIPGMKDIRLRDLPSFLRTTDPESYMIKFVLQEVRAASKAKALILNTFDALEAEALEALSAKLPRVYSIGPLPLMMNSVHDERLKGISLSLWKEDSSCIQWLDEKPPESVVFINFGSITVMTPQQLVEFAWGLANSKKPFLWVIRPDLISGETAILPPEFTAETRDRSMLTDWCPQEKVLKHPAIAGFLTHSGWNSTLESIAGGVPVICWPFFAEQQTNCRYSCVEWEMGMEIDNDVKRDEVEGLVRELVDGDKGKAMKKKALQWKTIAEEATSPGGSSHLNLEKLIAEVLSP